MSSMKQMFRILIILLLLISCISNSKIENGNYVEKIDGLNINYVVRGKGPIMLVGHPSSGKIGYELTLKQLEDKFTMVYYDSRGTGKSDAPTKIEFYKPEYSVKEIELIRQKIGAKEIWLFGHSDQSAIAFEYAIKYPKHLAGLILSGTSLVGTQSESIERRRNSENKRIAESKWFAKVIKDWDYMTSNNTTFDKNGNDISTAKIKWWTYNEETAQKVIPITKEITKAGRRKPINNEYYQETPEERNKYLKIQKQIRNLNTRILIINGKYDTNNPEEFAKELHFWLPNSKLVVIDKAGHFPWVEQPDETFKEIKKWLEE